MSLLSPPLQAVIDLFSGPLHGVRFADIDGEGLGALASEVESLGSEVEAYEAQLSSLRDSLTQKQETLLALAQQALAYARIYAESDEALSAELNEITLPRATKPRKAVGKSPSERSAKAKDEDNASEQTASPDTEPALPKGRRRVAAAGAAAKAEPSAPESEEEVAVAAKGQRRKLPTRSGRGR